MKKLVSITLAVLMMSATVSQANPRHHGHHGHHRHYNWIAPLVIGGVTGYIIANRANPQPPVIVQPNPAHNSIPFPVPPYGYRYEQILDANCNCYRWALVSN